MNQTKTGMSSGFPNTQNGFVPTKPKFISNSVIMLGSMLMIVLQLFAGKVNATNIPITSFTCTQTKNATMTCVGNGYYANSWVGNTGYWQYELNTVGYTGSITMTFSQTKSSSAGPTSGQVYYNIGAGDVAVSGGSFAVTTSCVSQVVTLPSVCAGVSGLIIKVKMFGATANTATHRITSQNVFDGTSASCSGAPAAGGTVSAASNPICGGTSAALTLSGATGGAGITYQWQSSPDNSTWSDISGATGLSYNTPALNDTTYYRVLVYCSAAPSTPTASSSLRVDVNTVAIAAITGYSAPLIIGTTQSLANATGGGLWLSSDESVATVDGSGTLTGIFGGTADISYQVTDFGTGCVGAQTITVNAVWPNTLALYAGSTGTNTNVIPVPGDAVSSLYATGFGAATPCGSGGLSGLTVNTSIVAFDSTAPHVGYTVYPDPGNALNMYRIHARARVSGTGPTKAVIAYRYWNGFTVSGWKVADNIKDLTSGSCGVMSNSWDFNTGIAANPNPTVNGITDSLEVAVFPFASSSNGGTFQLGSLEVYGIISDDDGCDGSPIVAADSALPAVVTICDSGYRFLNYNLGTGGVAGVGITYQWQQLVGGSWVDIIDAEGAVYQTDTLHAGMTSDTSYYRVQILCEGDPVGTSEPSMVVVSPTPANAGTISGGVVSSILPYDHMFIGAPTYAMSSTAGSGGYWSSNDTSVVSIDSFGVATPHIPGDAVITYRKAVGGCYGTSKDTVIALYDHTKAIYVGKSGNSTQFYTSADATSVGATADITIANWGSAATCGNGGISGLTNTTTVQDDATNGQVTMSVAPVSTPFNATEVRTTVRKQPSGAYKAYLGYRTAGSGSWTVSSPVDVESDDCGYSHNEIVFTFSSPVTVNSGYDFTVFGFNGTATTTLQVNTISVIGTGAQVVQKGTGIMNLAGNASVQVYPNPVKNTLNIDASEAVNVTIFSIDGKKLLEQKDVTSVDVSSLMGGMYLIQVSDKNNMLLKTEKFIKQ